MQSFGLIYVLVTFFLATGFDAAAQTGCPEIKTDAALAAQVLAPLKQYSRVSVKDDQDPADYASVFPAAGGVMHNTPAFFWIYPTQPNEPDFAADVARQPKLQGFGRGTTETLSEPRHLNVSCDRAYVVADAAGSAEIHGKREPMVGRYALGLERTGEGWRILAFDWQDAGQSLGMTQASPGQRNPVMAALGRYFANMDPTASNTVLASKGMIIDEFAPYAWIGPTAFADWWADFQRMMKSGGSSGLRVYLGKPTSIVVTEGRAYVVLPSRLTFRTRGKPDHEDGWFNVVLDDKAQGWRIDSWAWATK
jgi:hypothetical protein